MQHNHYWQYHHSQFTSAIIIAITINTITIITHSVRSMLTVEHQAATGAELFLPYFIFWIESDQEGSHLGERERGRRVDIERKDEVEIKTGRRETVLCF